MTPHPDPSQIRAAIAQDPGLEQLQVLTQKEMGRQGFDPGHDLAHCHRVAAWALCLVDGLEPREVVAAALLHDIVNLPKDHPERSTASARSAAFARVRLPAFGFEHEAVERIAGAIESHSYSRGLTPSTDLGRAIQDADRLETLGSIGLMRVFSTGARMGAQYFDPHDPWADDRPLDDLSYSIDHFATKLLLLPATMHTKRGRSEAKRRAERLRSFLRNLAEELGVEPPRWISAAS